MMELGDRDASQGGRRDPRRAYEMLLPLSRASRSIFACPRRMEHQSLCSATGIPHSTQIRTRCTGAGVFDEKSRLRNDIPGLQGTVANVACTQRAVTELHPSQSARSRRKHWLDERIRQRVGSASTTAHRIDDIQHDRRSPGAGLGARVSRWESLLANGAWVGPGAVRSFTPP